MSTVPIERSAARPARRGRNFLRRAWEAKLRLQKLVLIITSAAMTLLIAAQVVGRYVLDTSVYGIEELASYCAIWLYFIGGALGAWDRGHISASLMDILIGSDRARAVVRVITCLLTVILSGWMTVWAFQYFYWTASRGARSLELGMSMAWVHAALPVGLVLMTLYFLIEFVDEARRTFGGRP